MDGGEKMTKKELEQSNNQLIQENSQLRQQIEKLNKIIEIRDEDVKREKERYAYIYNLYEKTFLELQEIQAKKHTISGKQAEALKSNNTNLEYAISNYKKLYEDVKKEKEQLEQGYSKYISELRSKNQKFKTEQKKEHNERGAGRKPKLTDRQKQEIKKIYESGRSMREIAEEFSISKSTVHNIIRL